MSLRSILTVTTLVLLGLALIVTGALVTLTTVLNDLGQFEREVKLSPWAFVFGPSITVGSIGVFLSRAGYQSNFTRMKRGR